MNIMPFNLIIHMNIAVFNCVFHMTFAISQNLPEIQTCFQLSISHFHPQISQSMSAFSVCFSFQKTTPHPHPHPAILSMKLI